MYDDEEPEHPFAWVDRKCYWLINGQTSPLPPSIFIDHEVEDIMDEIVFAVILLEHRLRMSEKSRAVKIAAVSGGCPPKLAS